MNSLKYTEQLSVYIGTIEKYNEKTYVNSLDNRLPRHI